MASDLVPRFTLATWHTGLAYLQVMKLMAALIYRRHEQALQAALQAQHALRLMMAMPVAGTEAQTYREA